MVKTAEAKGDEKGDDVRDKFISIRIIYSNYYNNSYHNDGKWVFYFDREYCVDKIEDAIKMIYSFVDVSGMHIIPFGKPNDVVDVFHVIVKTVEVDESITN